MHLAQGTGDDVRVVEALLRADAGGAGVGLSGEGSGAGEAVGVGGASGRGATGRGERTEGGSSLSERADSRGCLPLHLAVGNGGSAPVVAALLRAGGGGAATRPDDDGCLPLHHAVGLLVGRLTPGIQSGGEMPPTLLTSLPRCSHLSTFLFLSRSCCLLAALIYGNKRVDQ